MQKIIPEYIELKGKLVLLKTAKDEDFPKIRSFLNHDKTMEHLKAFFDVDHWTIEKVKERYEGVRKEQVEQTRVHLIINPLNTEKIVGSCGLKHIDFNKKQCECGLILHENYWGSSVAFDCFVLCLDYAFKTLKIERVYFTTDEANMRARGFIRKFGVSEKGRDSKDFLLYDMSKGDWEKVRIDIVSRIK